MVGFANPVFQIHDYSPGIAANGLFWVIPTSRDSIAIDFEEGVATLRVRDVPVTDAHDLYNNLTKGQGYAPWGFRPSLPYQRRYRSTSSGVGLLTLRRWLT